MASEWKSYSLGKVTKWSSGGTPSKSNPEFWGGDIPWISASSMDGSRYRDSKLKITQEGLENGSRLAKKDSILLLVRGSILHQKIQVGIAERDVAFNQDVKCLIANETFINPWFLLYWFKANELSLLSKVENTGIGAGKLDTKLLQELKIDIPPKEIESKIVSFAKSIDDKIELNKKINQTLEQMAQAMFKSCFVDFDPVFDNLLAKHNNNLEKVSAYLTKKGAEDLIPKLQQRHKIQQTSDYKPLPDHIKKEFPSDFQHHEDMGWIPKGWEASCLGEHFNIVMGQSPKGDTYNEDGDGVVFFQGRKDFGFRYPTPRVYTTSPKRIAQKGDTLISVRAPVGDRNLANRECCLGRGVAALKHKSGASSFSYYLIGTIESKLADRGADGTVFSSINKKDLSGYPFLAANNGAIKEFESLVRTFDSKIDINTQQLNQLEYIKGTLLPPLIMGSIEIDN